MVLYLIPILVVCTLLTAAAAVSRIYSRRKRLSERLNNLGNAAEDPANAWTDDALPLWLQPITFLAWLMPGLIYSEVLSWDLARAGYRHGDARKVFAGTRVLTTAIAGLGFTLAAWTLKPHEVLMIAALGLIVGYFAPIAWLRMRQSKRQQEIRLALPDALDLLVICVEAGQGLNAALLKVGRESEFRSQVLGDELKMVNNEMQAGVARTQALRNLAMRTGVDDVRALVAVMIQSDRFGTSIARALRVHSQSLRTRRRQRAEETARKAPVKLVFPLVFCIFPELMVVILAPGMLRLFRALSEMSP